MISQAKDRDFHTLIIIPYRNSNDETRFCVPTEHQVTSPLPSLDAETIELRAPKPPEKPDIINQNWWTKIPKDSELSLCKNVMIILRRCMYGDFSIAPFIEKCEKALICLWCVHIVVDFRIMLCGAVAVKKELESTR
mgnify:CR=1 FL=1